MGEPARRTRRAASAVRPKSARTDATALDGVIHERARLSIVSALAAHPSLAFGELKELLGLTDGNLAVHARRLEEAGYVACTKGYAGRVPRTEYRLTPAGRRALTAYLEHMESIIRAARGGGAS